MLEITGPSVSSEAYYRSHKEHEYGHGRSTVQAARRSFYSGQHTRSGQQSDIIAEKNINKQVTNLSIIKNNTKNQANNNN